MPGKLNILMLAAALLIAPARGAFSGIPLSGGDNSIRRNLVSNGGAISTGAGFSLNCALAESVVSTFTGTGFKFGSGLMPLAAQPGTITALTAVTKSTGTLELAWTAPGLDGFLAGLTLGMAMLPEEFPVVLVIFLTIGAWRISRKNVLTRRMQAIETIGAATVLCTDKTGTLTLNSMRLRELWTEGRSHTLEDGTDALPEEFHALAEYSILASQADPFDPIEKELKRVGGCCLEGTEHLHGNWKVVREYPLLKNLLSLAHAWESPDHKRYLVAAKGAPEAIIDLCHLPAEAAAGVLAAVGELSGRGLRVLAVAKSSSDKGGLPEAQ
ncbi:MAG: hypothetical protein COT18_06335, partial [Elusimicrobia bacterium CG08_land_8_20_14_0_20_59_10]